MKNKILTIGIPTFNRKERVLESIKEIQKLIIQNIEILVIDNNSQDGTEEKIKELLLHDSRISYIKNHQNIGGVANISKVLKKSQGTYIFLISDEDKVNIEFIEDIIPILETKKFDLILGSIFDELSNFFYKKEIDKEYNSIFKISNNKLQEIVYRGYISGIILKKGKIDINIIYKYLVDSRHLYPHALAILTMIKDINIKTMSKTICFMKNDLGTEVIQQIDKKKIEYWEPIARIEQIKFLIEIIKDSELGYSLEEKKKLFSTLALRSSAMYHSELFLKQYINQRKIFYNSIMQLKEIKENFIMYNRRVLIKSRLKGVVKIFISKKSIMKIKNILERIK